MGKIIITGNKGSNIGGDNISVTLVPGVDAEISNNVGQNIGRDNVRVAVSATDEQLDALLAKARDHAAEIPLAALAQLRELIEQTKAVSHRERPALLERIRGFASQVGSGALANIVSDFFK